MWFVMAKKKGKPKHQIPQLVKSEKGRYV